MAGTGKAAVIHPTGTGKSIIAFKLIEDHPEKRVCWFSPSNYIVRTQRENVRRIEPNISDENVTYCTYARLMYMDQAEVSALKPDYIVLDEFHRCGAPVWGEAVNMLLKTYPEAPILGFSATNVRYLDSQRDICLRLAI
jgi:superfamily II DNA or RNA helicase